MKKFAIMMALVATLVSNGAYAQNNNNNNNNRNMNNGNNRNMNNNNNTGSAAQQGTYSTYDNLAWGIGLGGLAIIGVVVGVTVAGAVSSQSSFSH